MEKNDYERFFNHFKQLKETQRKQKQRGLNDFNLLTTVLKYSDEVRLHSRMLGGLLNPRGKHYQETLFLEHFIKTVGLETWGLEYENTSVHVEYKDIDIYITDGNKHLIIENKIWANDQPCQIMKYINIIVEENRESLDVSDEHDGHIRLGDNFQVIYLTPRAKSVSSAHAKEGNYIYFKGEKNADEELAKCSKRNHTEDLVPGGLLKYKVKYKKITYKEDVMKWLNACQAEVKNITNLNESIQQYINVVKRVNGNFEGNVMDFKTYVDKNSIEIQTIFTIKEEIETYQGNLLSGFFKNVIDNCLLNVNDEMKKNYKSLVYTKKNCRQWFKGSVKNFGTFYHLNESNLLYIFIGISYIHYGIVKHENYKLKPAQEDDENYGLEYRNWKKLKWFSKGYPHLDILNNAVDSDSKKEFKIGLKELIDKFHKKDDIDN